jgi:4a-hydroxytetrahydrobiopterin dehydratase
MEQPAPLSEVQITERLAGLPGWSRDGDMITRTFAHTYHECVHLAMYVAAKAREVGHHPDMEITWQRITFRITTHDAGDRLTEADFGLASNIDAIAAGHGASGVLSQGTMPRSGLVFTCAPGCLRPSSDGATALAHRVSLSRRRKIRGLAPGGSRTYRWSAIMSARA